MRGTERLADQSPENETYAAFDDYSLSDCNEPETFAISSINQLDNAEVSETFLFESSTDQLSGAEEAPLVLNNATDGEVSALFPH